MNYVKNLRSLEANSSLVNAPDKMETQPKPWLLLRPKFSYAQTLNQQDSRDNKWELFQTINLGDFVIQHRKLI
jgi:hypothetical protein